MDKTLVTINIDNTSFRLQKIHNFQWLKELGTVFCVFDEQDSGNICFGIKKDGVKSFVKYAGAKTVEYKGDVKDAILRLKKAIPLYEDLKCPILIELKKYFETECGYAAIFKWVDGECLHSHWAFNPYEKYNNPNSPFYKYKHLSVEQRLKSLDEIFSFHKYVEEKGYVAVDFYDGSIIYDFENNITNICDIDFYRKKPTINDIDEDFWGAKRSKAPEEYQLGELIDERTNVYTMGSIAFEVLGGEMDHSIEKLGAGEELYKVAVRATEINRTKRYCSVSEFHYEWKNVVKTIN
ncbi:serine/threonine protein kinase [Clostridium gasigenes]|uniref:serine/threonine protein kinase n=2 Tax=Clostridium gasigenes TaxID=94869 RepID=UPI001C0AFE22|nr:serine/threonine protein kinase [Clostridium gasigenes]MBU3104524.1 serine/threonine protein kinase [Clostridium gasigenes]